MALNDINSKIDSSNIIRQRSVRASKDKAIARIAVPFEYEAPKKAISRSKTVIIKKTYVDVNEIEKQMRTRLSISVNEDDDDDEDNYDKSESESSESYESSSSESNVSEGDIPKSKVNNVGVQRRKTFAGGRPSVAIKSNSDNCMRKTERKLMTAESFAEEMPCRQEEFDDIYMSISTLMGNGDGGCIFVVGLPGTGKTATVSAVIDCLEAKESNLPAFNRVTINGMHVTETREVYSSIYKELTNKTVSKKRAVASLESELLKKSKLKKPTVILIDEIDQLHTKKEDILYKIFGWTQRRDSRLVIIAIANTMDMPERLTQNKVTSRSGLTRFAFSTYTNGQLLTILRAKLAARGLKTNIDQNALELAAKKVAADSGDVRRILEISRRLFELHKTGKKINIELVNFILKEMSAVPMIAAIRDNCSFYEKVFLRAIVAACNRSGVQEAPLKDIARFMGDMCSGDGVRIPNNCEILSIVTILGSYKLINYDSLANDIYTKVKLNCFPEQVTFALNNK